MGEFDESKHPRAGGKFTAGTGGTAGTAGTAPRPELVAFAKAALAKVDALPHDDPQRFGRNKAFISALAPSKATKRMLMEAHQAGLVNLTRFDNINGGSEKGSPLHTITEKSEIGHPAYAAEHARNPNSTLGKFHLIETPTSIPSWSEKSLASRTNTPPIATWAKGR